MPDETATKASSKVGQGSGSICGNMSRQAMSELAPNSPWKPQEFAERARKYWSFAHGRVERWSRGERAPKLLVAVAKGNGRILGAFEIDNRRWALNRLKRFVAVPLRDKTNANFRNLQGKTYVGNRQGGAVTYGSKVG